ncbi:MAG: DUF6796 family protein, partial [Myxococcota bacterium]
MRSQRTLLGSALIAALAASAGDLLLLFVGNSLRPELGLPRPPGFVLTLGGVLGVVGIPFFALGYQAISREIEAASPALARIVLGCGAAGAAVGGVIHGLTALAIHTAIVSGAAAAPPLEAVAASGGVLAAAWVTASALLVAASLAIAAVGVSRSELLPRWLTLLNPAAVTVLLALCGLEWEWGRSFLVPAAPNLAHVVFFACAYCALSR